MTVSRVADPLTATRSDLEDKLASAGGRLPESARIVREVTTGDEDDWRTWDEVFGPANVVETISAYRQAVGAPDQRLAAALLVSEVLRGVVWLNVPLLTLCDRVVDVRTPTIRFGSSHKEIPMLVNGASVLTLPGDHLSGPGTVPVADRRELTAASHRMIEGIRDELIEAVSVTARMPRRLIDGNTAMAWHAVLRWIVSVQSGWSLNDLWEHQWEVQRGSSALTRELPIATPDGRTRQYMVRTVCCLEYRLGPPESRTYCGTCPLLPDEKLARYRESVDRGEKSPPLTDADRVRPAGREH